MTSSELLASIRKRLAALACPNHRDGMTNYFKGSIVAYGVRTPEVRRLASGNWKIFKEWSPDERERFCETLWKDGWFEEGALAIYLYRRLAPRCGAREFRLFQSWIERHVGNWAHCDGVASWLISASIAKEPELMDKLPPWTMSRNRWKRRAAAVSLLQEAKMGRSTSHVLGIADAMLDDADDRKAWAGSSRRRIRRSPQRSSSSSPHERHGHRASCSATLPRR
jgi:3-methyladenine DNA glycosylase AlkD